MGERMDQERADLRREFEILSREVTRLSLRGALAAGVLAGTALQVPNEVEQARLELAEATVGWVLARRRGEPAESELQAVHALVDRLVKAEEFASAEFAAAVRKAAG